MKRVSFSIPSSSSSKRSKLTTSSSPSSPDQTKEYITEFDSSQTTQNSKNHLIIPPIPNQWKPLVSNVEKQDPNATNNVFDILDDTKLAKNINHAEEKPMPWIERLKLRKLKDDGLEKVHDDEGVEEFDLSVDEFANAYMKRYGWCEGKGVGKNAERDKKDVEYKKGNNTRVGLGFVGDNGGER